MVLLVGDWAVLNQKVPVFMPVLPISLNGSRAKWKIKSDFESKLFRVRRNYNVLFEIQN